MHKIGEQNTAHKEVEQHRMLVSSSFVLVKVMGLVPFHPFTLRLINLHNLEMRPVATFSGQLGLVRTVYM